ncbi:hypothetical protein SC206_05665 [Rouxiella sp. T17]|uniref:hypothetical protein n=1 Tax=Rouxiella sp. T17 TaxID=3085684 RepID=UPI002FC85E56
MSQNKAVSQEIGMAVIMLLEKIEFATQALLKMQIEKLMTGNGDREEVTLTISMLKEFA